MNKSEFIRKITIRGNEYNIIDINILEKKGIADIKKLPYSIRILVENLLRKLDDDVVKEEDVLEIARWRKKYDIPVEIPFHPGRVLMQDFTGVPVMVDLAAMRDAVKDLGGNPEKINLRIPVELIIDHSIQVDYYGAADSLQKNVEKEYQRNKERYGFLKWAQNSFSNLSIVPPNSGICHQINLEYLGKVIITERKKGEYFAFPDTLVGTDSHTTMINGIGIVGWGVGGIEAEAVMLGQPYYMQIPEVIGVKIFGEINEGVTATDLVLSLTELIRKHGVVEKFVEYFGPGIKNLPVTDRATIANMAPEYGATLGFFPVDEQTIAYLKMTDRVNQAEIVEQYTKELDLFYSDREEPIYSGVLEFDLSSVKPSVAGPARPQDRIELNGLRNGFNKILEHKYGHDRAAMPEERNECVINIDGKQVQIGEGFIAIAAITSCTNTSNPSVMIGAGLLAKKAVELGLKTPPYVKTSFAPGSRVVINYLEEAGLMDYLAALGFHLAGFGCTTCIGNSGPLHPEVEKAILDNNLSAAAILSGNRNFEARIHRSISTNFLASPILVVAFAITGRIDIDLTTEPLAFDKKGNPVFLEDIWPTSGEIQDLMHKHLRSELFKIEYDRIYDGDSFWENLSVVKGTTYPWDGHSTYLRKPPYFEDFTPESIRLSNLENARILLLLGDSVTTDHISPAGEIPKDYPAGQYLDDKNVAPADYNTYGARRGNHEIMKRGTFGNIRIKNKLLAPKEGSFTTKYPEELEMFIYDAAMNYINEGVPLVVLGGKEYGSGSSRDWAAKGTAMLGVKVVICESFERIHRNNLIGMGVLPLIFKDNDSCESLGLEGSETVFIHGIEDITPRKVLEVTAIKKNGSEINFEVIARLDTEVDVKFYKNGGILPYILRKELDFSQ